MSLEKGSSGATTPTVAHDARSSPVHSLKEGSIPMDHTVSLDEDSPKNMPLIRKWVAVVVISSSALCVACTSSIASFAEAGEAISFHVSHEATILGISLFVAGLGCGPMLLGPLSEFYGRNPVYWVSYFLFWAFGWPVAFAPNLAVFCVFRFLSGFSGSAFLSVAGGSVSDLFDDKTVAPPMAFYTLSPFLGPVLGPLIAAFINQDLNWRWTYRVQLVWAFVQYILLVLIVPETYEPILLKRKVDRLRKSSKDPSIYPPVKATNRSLGHAILISCYTPFQILFYDRMALFLDLWSALVLGILYLAFQAFPFIFSRHGFNIQETGMSFLGIGLGITMGVCAQPIWTRIYRIQAAKNNGIIPPESFLIPGMPGGIIFAASLLLLSGFSSSNFTPALPLLFSVPMGLGIALIFIAVFTYTVTAYRPVAASAMAANSALRSAFAAGFPLFAGAMYDKLGSVKAGCLLGGIMAGAAVLPFFFFVYGPQIRKRSRFAVQS